MRPRSDADRQMAQKNPIRFAESNEVHIKAVGSFWRGVDQLGCLSDFAVIKSVFNGFKGYLFFQVKIGIDSYGLAQGIEDNGNL